VSLPAAPTSGVGTCVGTGQFEGVVAGPADQAARNRESVIAIAGVADEESITQRPAGEAAVDGEGILAGAGT